jgi:pilus assembly protein CpaD
MKHHSIRAYTLAASALMLLALAACTSSANWSEVQAPKHNQVEPVRLVHDVRFVNGAQLSPVEMAQLDGFIARHDIGYGDRVYVLMENAGAPSQRTTNVLNYMKAHGIGAAGLPSVEAQPGLVRIVVNRHVVVPPNCPDWSKPMTADYTNLPMSNLGCSTNANLGGMLADPGELIQGRQPGAADAEGSAGAIRRYRKDEIKPLEKVTSGGK